MSSEDSLRGAPVAGGALTALLRDLVKAPAPGSEELTSLFPGQVMGRFELVRPIGRGGFGTVWEARDRQLGRSVALKLLRYGGVPVLEERLLAEAEAAARLAHPNIVTLHDVGNGEHGPFLVLELLRGETLATRLRRGLPEPAEAVRIGVEVAKALAHAHGAGVLHRDLSPSNVFLCSDGRVKLLDLGMALAFGRKKAHGGTPAYMAPEQRQGTREDERTDVFALGVILFRMIAGMLPFGAHDTSYRRPATVRAPTAALGTLVGRMLERDPAKRPGDMRRIVEQLEESSRAFSSTPAMGSASAEADQHTDRGEPRPREDRGDVIAVLPFADMSPGQDQGHLADGIAEEILNVLAYVDGLRVVGRTLSFAFRGSQEDLRSIGSRLGAGLVLEGAIRRDGARVRVTADLVRVGDGCRQWSGSYDTHLADVLAAQNEIARAVVEELRRHLVPIEALERRDQPVEPEIHNQVLLGRAFARRLTQRDLQRAAEAFGEALRGDPRHAPAWAGLAHALYMATSSPGDPEDTTEGYTRALDASERAVALDPHLAEAYVIRGMIRGRFERRWPEAGSDLQRALALQPGDTGVQRAYARYLCSLGRTKEALPFARRATDLDPLSASSWSTLGLLLLRCGRTGPAQVALRRSMEILPEQDHAPYSLGLALLLEGRPDAALSAFQLSTSAVFQLTGLALCSHERGQESEVRRSLDELSRFARHAACQVAGVHAWRGDLESAFAWLDRASAQREPDVCDVKTDPLFRAARSDARFGDLLRALRLPMR